VIKTEIVSEMDVARLNLFRRPEHAVSASITDSRLTSTVRDHEQGLCTLQVVNEDQRYWLLADYGSEEEEFLARLRR